MVCDKWPSPYKLFSYKTTPENIKSFVLLFKLELEGFSGVPEKVNVWLFKMKQKNFLHKKRDDKRRANL